MNNLIVRKARKDYICNCCGHIIAKGTEYIDNVVLKYGSVVKHERYHDECPAKSEVERLFKRIIDADGDLIVSEPSGDKHHIIGIRYSGSVPYVVAKDWDEGISLVTMDIIKSWIDEHGDRILQND